MKLFSLAIASLVATGFASPILSTRQPASVTEDELAEFRLFTQYCVASGCNNENAPGDPIICGGSACPDAEANGAVTVSSFIGPITDIRGFVAVDPVKSVIVVAFRGSASIQNWITDFIFTLVPCDLVSGCLLHLGFKTAWEEVDEAVLEAVATARKQHPDFRIVVTGHSLGGAVATVAAGEIRAASYPADLVTYGSPRVGNEQYVAFVTAQPGREYRITHLDDIVPRLPPALLGYRHTSPEYWLNGGNETTTDYGVEDIKVCEGTFSLGCNSGVLDVGLESHGYYLQEMSGCTGAVPAEVSRVFEENGGHLLETAAMFAKLDVEYVERLDKGESLLKPTP